MSVKIIAMPCSSAAAITSSSRIEPPLDHTGDTHSSGRIDSVAEREEGIRGHGGAFHFQTFVACFDTGNFAE